MGDDPAYITENKYFQGKFSLPLLAQQSLATINGEYVPLTVATFTADSLLWGFNPKGFRLTNLLIFFFIGATVFSLSSRLNEDTAHGDTRALKVAALIATGFVMLHPVHVESVASISSRKELLYVLFGLLALKAYTASPEKTSSLAAAMLFLLLAQLSKGTAFVLPLIFLAYELLYRKLWTKNKVRIRPLIISFIVSWSVFAYQFSVALQHVIQTLPPGIPPGARIAGAGRILNLVITRFFIPGELSYEYEILWPRTLNIGAEWLAPAALMLFGAYLLRQRRYDVLFLLSISVLSLGPYLNLLPIHHGYPEYMVHYDHYLLMPFVSLSMPITRGLLNSARWKHALLIVLLVVSALFAYQVRAVSGYWKTRETLYRRCIETAPAMARGYVFLGMTYNDLGRSEEAIPLLQKARRLDTHDQHILKVLGNAYAFAERYAEAEKVYAEYLKIKPEDGEALQNMANTLVMLGRFSEAREIIGQWLRLSPGNPSALYILRFAAQKEALGAGR